MGVNPVKAPDAPELKYHYEPVTLYSDYALMDLKGEIKRPVKQIVYGSGRESVGAHHR